MTQDVRLEQLTEWINTLPDWQGASLAPASADASFRRYFRVTKNNNTAIAMDAPSTNSRAYRYGGYSCLNDESDDSSSGLRHSHASTH